jgi:uncharacterized protein
MDEARSRIVETTRAHVRQALAGDPSGHDGWHVERVWRMARLIGEREGADPFVVELAALLHDVADWKMHGGDLDIGPRRAREWLESLGAEPAVVERVSGIVRGVSFKGAGVPDAPLPLEGRVVRDADRLDAIGAIGIARAFAYGGHRGRPLHDPERAASPHDSFEAYRDGTGATLHHFHEKLLLLRDRMETTTGREIAVGRHEFMERFLERFAAEWEGRA